MDNLIIIGSGPAGISAALYSLRAGIATTIISTGKSALDTAIKVDNYYGFPAPISGPDLIENGMVSARRLGAVMVEREVVRIEDKDGGFVVATAEGEIRGGAVILATGASWNRPKWPGIDTYEGMGVSYCAVCDGFFFRGKDVVVAGSGPYALHEAEALLPLVNSVTLCTDGEPLTCCFPPEIKIISTPVAALEGDETGEADETGKAGKTDEIVKTGSGVFARVRFEDKSTLEASALFVAIGTAGSSELANAIGADISANGDIVVDDNMRTSIPGLLAAGDCTGGMMQIAKAVYEGAKAGTEAAKMLAQGL